MVVHVVEYSLDSFPSSNVLLNSA